MPSIEFLRPRLHGARFEDGGVPLEVLSDLAALQDMVIEVAKWRFLKENPGRNRSPRGFTNIISLKITGVEGGSTTPVIHLSADQPTLPGVSLPYQELFERAREDIIDAIASAEQGRQPTANGLPSRYLAYFNRIGRSLRDGEFVEFATPRRQTPARLTKESRHRLLQLSSMTEFTQEVTLRGSISEADQDKMTFELQPVFYGRKVVGPMPEQLRETVIEAFNGYRDGVRVLVQGIGKYDRQNRLVGLESVGHISLLDPLDVPARLDEFRGMADGWLEGSGLAPSHAGLDWLADSFERHFPDDLPLPHVYPTPEGGVEAEWSLGAQSVIFEVDLVAHQGDWLCFDKQSDDETDETSRVLHLDDDKDWAWLVAEILSLAAPSV